MIPASTASGPRTVVKANYVPMARGGARAAQSSADYYSHRPDEEGKRYSRDAFDANNDRMEKDLYRSVLDREAAEYEDGYMYRIVVSPGEEMDADDLRDHVRGVMEHVEEENDGRWMGWVHDDQTEHPHAHVICYSDERLDTDDFYEMRQEGDAASLSMGYGEDYGNSYGEERYEGAYRDDMEESPVFERRVNEKLEEYEHRGEERDVVRAHLAVQGEMTRDEELNRLRDPAQPDPEDGINPLERRQIDDRAREEAAETYTREGWIGELLDGPYRRDLEDRLREQYTDELRSAKEPSDEMRDPDGILGNRQMQDIDDRAERQAAETYTREGIIGELLDGPYRRDLEDKLRDEYTEGAKAGVGRGLDEREVSFVEDRVERESAREVESDNYKWQGGAHAEIRGELREHYQEDMQQAKERGRARGLDDREIRETYGRAQREIRDVAEVRGWSDEKRREMEPKLRDELQHAASIKKELGLDDGEAKVVEDQVRSSDVTLTDREARKLEQDRGPDYWRGVAYSEAQGASRGEARQIEESIRRQAADRYRTGPIGDLLDRGRRHDHEDRLRAERLQERGYGL